jgi:hypothetical protein
VNFTVGSQQPTLLNERKYLNIYEPEFKVRDARDLSFLQNSSIDLICAHPPYANIIHYTNSKEDDLSFFDIDEFLKEMSKVAQESFRVLKPGRKCAILIGDTRREKYVVPLGFRLINIYLNAGFRLRELVIKRQHNCKTTGFWYTNSIKYNFLLLSHEYLPIFEKPEKHLSLNVKERETNYGIVIPTFEKPVPKRKLSGLETTTVWILPEKNFEALLNKNVIERYSDGKNYSIVTFIPSPKNEENLAAEMTQKKHKQLLFIKSLFFDNNLSHSSIEFYLEEIKKSINQELFSINKGGFLVIQTKDVKVDGYTEPLAIKLVNILTHPELRLKETIIVSQEGINSVSNSTEYLRITHQYLLVYEVQK